jgi:hypothetical protein
VHELVGVSGEVFPVTPADPGLSVGAPGSEAIESDDKKTCSKGEAEVELGEGSEHMQYFFLVIFLDFKDLVFSGRGVRPDGIKGVVQAL